MAHISKKLQMYSNGIYPIIETPITAVSIFIKFIAAEAFDLHSIAVDARCDAVGYIKLHTKYNIKKIHTSQSNALSLIFEPNVTSILNYFKNPKVTENLNIFEKIWLGKF